MLLKPEEVPKKTKKKHSPRSLGAWRPVKLCFLFFLVPPQVLARFSPLDFGFFLVPPQVLAIVFLKTLPKPEEVPKKPKFLRPPRPRPPNFGFLGLFGTSSGFGKKRFCFFWYLLRFWHDFFAKA